LDIIEENLELIKGIRITAIKKSPQFPGGFNVKGKDGSRTTWLLIL